MEQLSGFVQCGHEATRTDLAFAIRTVSQHMTMLGWSHWMAVKRILRDLEGSLHLKLQLGGQNIKLIVVL